MPARSTTLVSTCTICGETRPTTSIGLTVRPRHGVEWDFPRTRINVAHCLDRPGCVLAVII